MMTHASDGAVEWRGGSAMKWNDGSDDGPPSDEYPGTEPPEPRPSLRAQNGAAFVAMPRSLPGSLVAGRRYDVTVTMRNLGTSTWRAEGAQPYRLGSHHPRDNTVWGLGRIDVPADVPPGGEATFAFTVVAPEAPGRYHFQWQMVQDGVGWFGEASQDVVVQVVRLRGPGDAGGARGLRPSGRGRGARRSLLRRDNVATTQGVRLLRYRFARGDE
jgi:hypothetical protein